MKKIDNTIVIKEDVRIPGTDIILEKGDKIAVVKEASGGWEGYINSIPEAKKYIDQFKKLGYDIFMSKHSYGNRIDVSAIDRKGYLPELYVNMKDEVEIQTTSYGGIKVDEFSKFMQDISNGYEAGKLLEKCISDKALWNKMMTTDEFKANLEK